MEGYEQDYLYEASMNTARLVLCAALGLLLDSMGYNYETLPFWAVLGAIIAYGWLSYADGYESATVLSQAAWQQAKTTLEEAIAREERVQQLLKDYKDTQ